MKEANTYTNTDERTLYLCDDVDNKSIGSIITAILEIQAYDDKKDEEQKNYERKPIKLYVQSIGGTAYDMWGLVDLILNSKTPVHTYSIGYSMSAGFKIFIAGHKRFVFQHSTLLYHQLSSGCWGKYKDMVESLQENTRLQNEIEEYVLSHTKITKAKLDEVREKKLDWYITAKEAIELGIADEIVY